MEKVQGFRLALLTLLAAALVLPFAQARAARITVDEPAVSGVRVHVDNDLLAGGQQDRDYTGGAAVTISGSGARDAALSLDPLLTKLDGVFTSEAASGPERHARQFGLMVFTPADTLASEPQHDDRPYASLLFVSNGRMRVDADDRGAWFSSMTVGVLGLDATEDLHSVVHALVGSAAPRGYDHQISAGGEPTARYSLARQKLIVANPTATLDVKTTAQGSVGFLTETSAAISMRVGRFDTPWWSFQPELGDYLASPVPIENRRALRPEFYFFAGAKLKARAHNVFLQGQFQHSPVRLSASEIEPLVAEAWLGIVTQLFEQTQMSYTLNYQTAEVRSGKAARDSLWGGVQLTHSF